VVASQPRDCGLVRVWISEPELLSDLVESLSRACCHVERCSEDEIGIGSPSPLLTPDQARKEIGLYLVLWRVKHPGVRMTVED
jgi:hypothetical protein